MKKKWLFISLVSLISIPVALAGVGDTLSNVWQRILSIGNLSLLGLSDSSAVVALTRILIWILMFTVFFALLSFLGGKEGRALGFLKRNHAIVVAAVLATISAIFLPAPVLLATGTGWATAVALLLIGGPIVGLIYLLWLIPGKDEEGRSKETKATVMLKIFLCLLLFWILSAMKVHVGRMI